MKLMIVILCICGEMACYTISMLLVVVSIEKFISGPLQDESILLVAWLLAGAIMWFQSGRFFHAKRMEQYPNTHTKEMKCDR